jgi:SPP1 gp7 family putative phage head morphogenesis protein
MPTDPGDKSRGQLLELEKRRQMAVVSDFARIRDRLENDLRDLLERIEKERRIDGNASPGLLLQKARLGEILDSIDNEIAAASERLAAMTAGAQSKAVDIARNQSEQYPQVTTELGFFDGDAVKEIIGNAGDGQPLQKIFAAIAAPTRQAIFDALEFGLAAGLPNASIAAEVRDAIGGGTARAMTIVRTETNRAYREATRKFYQQAPGVVGWRWLAALDLRTCPICWALHGQVFKTKTRFGTHPNCRCTMVPVFAGEADFQTGPLLFRLLNGTQQKAILGPKRYQMFLDGAELKHFVGQVRTPFGIGRVVKPINKTQFTKLATPRVPIEPAGPTTGGGVPIARPLPPRSSSTTPTPALGSRLKAGDPVPPSFTSAKDATEYMAARFPATRWDFARVDPALLHPQVKELTELLDKYPAVADRLKYVGTYSDRSKIIPRDSGRFASNAIAHCANDGSFIAFNPKYYGNAAKFRATKKRAKEVGFSVTDKDNGTASHEFGHAIESALNANKNNSFFKVAWPDGRNEVGPILRRVFRNLKPAKGELSDYGLHNNAERFAEGFSMIRNRRPTEWPAFVRAQRLLIEKLEKGEIYTNDEITEFRNLSPDEQAAARAEFETFITELGLKVK